MPIDKDDFIWIRVEDVINAKKEFLQKKDKDRVSIKNYNNEKS